MEEHTSRPEAIDSVVDRRVDGTEHVPVDAEDDYRALAAAGVRLSLIAFAAKAVASLVFARWYGAEIEVRRLFGWFPYLSIRTSRPVFAEIVTWSSVMMTVAVVVAFLALSRRPGSIRERRLRAAGSFAGPTVVLLTLGLEYLRHLRNAPALYPGRAGLCLAALVIVTIAGLITFPRDRRRDDPSADLERSGELVTAP